jgi:hypothetical protein
MGMAAGAGREAESRDIHREKEVVAGGKEVVARRWCSARSARVSEWPTKKVLSDRCSSSTATRAEGEQLVRE